MLWQSVSEEYELIYYGVALSCAANSVVFAMLKSEGKCYGQGTLVPGVWDIGGFPGRLPLRANYHTFRFLNTFFHHGFYMDWGWFTARYWRPS